MPGEHIEGLIERLLDAEVEFVVIGGMAAVLHGAPIATNDLDIVHHDSVCSLCREHGQNIHYAT